MKFLPSLVLALALGTSSQADVVIVQKIESPMMTGELTMKVQGQKTRADITKEISMITDGASGDMTTIMHAQKQFMTMSGTATKALTEQMQKQMTGTAGAQPTTPPKLTPTGKTETINGYKADEFVANTGNIEVHYWLAKDFPDWAKLLDQFLVAQQGGMNAALKNMSPDPKSFTGMPVRTEMQMNGQNIRTTIMSVKEEAVPATEFEPPAGYTEMTMPAGMGAPAAP